MHKNHGPVDYGDYLHLDTFLDAQKPLSKKYGDECHDEMLFIVVHQSYELWFKHILHEMRAIIRAWDRDFVPESELFSINHKLERIIKIQGLFLQHLEILETMTPMEFLEFRELLIPASGFQSVQFREIEIRMGLRTDARQSVDREYFMGRLKETDRQKLLAVEKEASLVEILERWLERMPFTNSQQFNFWQAYQKAVQEMMASDRTTIENNLASLSEHEKKNQLANNRTIEETFQSLFDEEKYKETQESKLRRISQKATLNALFIMLYRQEPVLSYPFQVLNALTTIDENFTNWRFRHSLLVHRMLGTKIGTGGSSGHQYLRKATDTNRVFVDLFNLATFIIPRSQLPQLPEGLKNTLQFQRC